MLPKKLQRTLVAPFATLCLAGGAAWADQHMKGQALSMPADLSGYTYVNSLVINDKESPLYGFHQFYVNDKGLDPLKSGGPYPTGTVFVGMVYEVKQDGTHYNDGEGMAVTLMKKVDGAEQTRGWRFAQFKPDGTAMEIDEKKDCFQCHAKVADQHFVFSQPLQMGDMSNL